MKVKKITSALILLLTLCIFTAANADTLLFPVIVSNYPNVVTIVSVTNPGPSTGYLRYDYDYKSAYIGGLPNYSGGCSVQSFVRHDFIPDVVSFDVSGIYNGGFALFNDPDVGLYGGSFKLTGGIPPLRAYLLVTNSDAAGNRVNIGSTASLRGEAVLLEIFSGAAWGYKAINDITREDFSFYSVSNGGGLYNVMSLGESRRFSFFDLVNWTTRFFVTPLGSNMHAIDRTSTIRLYNTYSIGGINGRGNDIYYFNKPQTMKCTAGVDLTDLLDSTAKAALMYTGGWGWIRIDSGDDAVIYKLEYVFQNPSYGGTNNNAFLLSGID